MSSVNVSPTSSLSRSVNSLALGRPEDEIGYDADFFADLGGSSLDYFSLIAGLRDEFGVSFTSGDMSRSTVRQLHDYIIERV